MKLHTLFEHLTLGPVTSYTNLSFVPVFGPDAIKDDLLLVDEALRTGYFTVTDSGQISLLLADNRLGMKIFVPSGAIVEGRTQNRVSEFPAVIPPRSKGVQLAVRCAEQGQPLSAGSHFSSSETIIVASARSGSVDQRRTWDTISGTITSFQAHSPTSDYASAARSTDFVDYLSAIGPPLAGQRGYIAAIGGGHEVCFYADIFGSRKLYEPLHRRLWQSVAAVAKSTSRRPGALAEADFSSFLMSAARMELVEEPTDPRLAGRVYLGHGSTAISALVCEDKLLQVALRRDTTDHEATVRPSDDTIMFPGRQTSRRAF